MNLQSLMSVGTVQMPVPPRRRICLLLKISSWTAQKLEASAGLRAAAGTSQPLLQDRRCFSVPEHPRPGGHRDGEPQCRLDGKVHEDQPGLEVTLSSSKPRRIRSLSGQLVQSWKLTLQVNQPVEFLHHLPFTAFSTEEQTLMLSLLSCRRGEILASSHSCLVLFLCFSSYPDDYPALLL